MRGYAGVALCVAGLLVACSDDDSVQSEPHPAPTAPAVQDALQGREFVADHLMVDGLEHPAAGNGPIGIDFLEAGRVSGSGGCNDPSGAYRLEGDVLLVDSVEMHLKGCGAELNAQDELVVELLRSSPTVAEEDAFLANLAGTHTLTIDGATAQLDGDGVMLREA